MSLPGRGGLKPSSLFRTSVMGRWGSGNWEVIMAGLQTSEGGERSSLVSVVLVCRTTMRGLGTLNSGKGGISLTFSLESGGTTSSVRGRFKELPDSCPAGALRFAGCGGSEVPDFRSLSTVFERLLFLAFGGLSSALRFILWDALAGPERLFLVGAIDFASSCSILATFPAGKMPMHTW
jgi:hypothetical protein